jgi:putative Mg2+ transporter-C (MgtC) family protein
VDGGAHNRYWAAMVAIISSPDLLPFANSFVRLAVAFTLGTLIGLERQYRQRTAGLRTNVLVAIGAAAFTDMGMRLLGPEGATRIISYIVSGIGFLGAGVIMKEGTNVRGLNTAATLWSSAAVGAFAGSGLAIEAAMLTAFVLAGNTLLRPLVNYINRQPMDELVTEALYRVHAMTRPADVADARELLFEELERANYPIREIETLSEGEEQVELAALLVPTTANPNELDSVVAALEGNGIIESAAWTVSTTS